MSIVLKHGEGWVGLTASIIDSAPALRGAACVGKTDLFDPKEGRESDQAFKARSAKARLVCAECPVRRDCIDWVNTITRYRVSGVLPANPRRKLSA